MTELLFLLAGLLIYLYSFLYKMLALFASGLLLWVAYLTNTNILYVVGIILILGIIRVNKRGIKDEY